MAGVAAGTVVGVLAVAGAVGGTFFYMRRKRNNEIEEEHRRNAAVNSFIGGGGGGHSVGGSVTDARLDPIMAQRRMSDGSIADNEDYSRRILRVSCAPIICNFLHVLTRCTGYQRMMGVKNSIRYTKAFVGSRATDVISSHPRRFTDFLGQVIWLEI